MRPKGQVSRGSQAPLPHPPPHPPITIFIPVGLLTILNFLAAIHVPQRHKCSFKFASMKAVLHAVRLKKKTGSEI